MAGQCQRLYAAVVESLGYNPPFATVSKVAHFRSLHDASVHSAVFINEYLAIDSCGSVSV